MAAVPVVINWCFSVINFERNCHEQNRFRSSRYSMPDLRRHTAQQGPNSGYGRRSHLRQLRGAFQSRGPNRQDSRGVQEGRCGRAQEAFQVTLPIPRSGHSVPSNPWKLQFEKRSLSFLPWKGMKSHAFEKFMQLGSAVRRYRAAAQTWSRLHRSRLRLKGTVRPARTSEPPIAGRPVESRPPFRQALFVRPPSGRPFQLRFPYAQFKGRLV